MIRVIKDGNYRLFETKDYTRILELDSAQYAWVTAEKIGEILVLTHSPHNIEQLLSMGKYRLYEVRDEPKLVDEPHLELHICNKAWQAYLLPTGLPTKGKSRSRLIPTKEVISRPKG